MYLPGIPRELYARPRTPELTFLNAPHRVRLGVLDPNARYVYTHGQCPSLAVMLQALYDWTLVGIWCDGGNCAPDHMPIFLPHGSVLDINGVHGSDEMLRFYDYACQDGPHTYEGVDSIMVDEWEREESIPAQDYQAARVFAVAVAQRYVPDAVQIAP